MADTIGSQDVGGPADAPAVLTLTDSFELAVDGRRLPVPHSVERLLAYLALAQASVLRTKLAGILWYDTPEERAASNLRTALWRLHKASAPLVCGESDRLTLSRDVSVDANELFDLTHRLIRGADNADLSRAPLLASRCELLPDWDEFWVVAERERFRLLRLQALESAASTLLDQRRPGDALVVALAAVRSEPLRESAWRLVVRVHLHQGNLAEAVHAYNEYRSMMHEELRMAPSRLMQELIAPIIPSSA